MKKRTKLFVTVAFGSSLLAAGGVWLGQRGLDSAPAGALAETPAVPAAEEDSAAGFTTLLAAVEDPGNEAEALRLPLDQPEPVRDVISRRYRHDQERSGRLAAQAKVASSARPTREQLVERLRREEGQRIEAAHEKARALGLEINSQDEAGNDHALVGFHNNTPIYKSTLNWRASFSTAANVVRDTPPYNVTGDGVRVGVWDAGNVRDTHQEFRRPTGGSRVMRRDAPDPTDPLIRGPVESDHATHVAGTIAASGVNLEAMGMAPEAIIESYDWLFDFAEMAEAGAAYPGEPGSIPISNHSYKANLRTGWERDAIGTFIWQGDWFGYYTTFSQGLDEVAHTLPYYLSVWAAGNERGDNPEQGEEVGFWVLDTSKDPPEEVLVFVPYDPDIHPVGDGLREGLGFNTVSHYQTAKNILVVGAVTDAVNDRLRRDPESATIAPFSSMGPTIDGRIVPHVVGGGVNVLSPVAFRPELPFLQIPSDTSYDRTSSGTSMAAPNVTGSITLLIDYYNQRFPGHALRASTVKALVVNTADDVGQDGPDHMYGFGLMDTKAAAETIRRFADNPAGHLIREDVLAEGDEKEFAYVWDGQDPIRVTVAWNDPPYSGPLINEEDEEEDFDEERLQLAVGAKGSFIASPTPLGFHDDNGEGDENGNGGEEEEEPDFTVPVLVNNLDIRVIGPDGVEHFPYVLDLANPADPATQGKNDVDNLEQVVIALPQVPGTYRVVVGHDGVLEDGEQIFSLVISGVSNAATAPAPAITSVSPDTLEVDSFSSITIRGENFQLGTRVWLTGPEGARVDASGIEILPGELVVRFDMHGQKKGPWDLTVESSGGQSHTLPEAIQLVESCGFEISPERRVFTTEGGEGTINVTALQECSWSAVADVDWIEIVDGETGAGSGVVTYRVLPFELPVDEEEEDPVPGTLDNHDLEDPDEEDEFPEPEFGPRTGTITVAGLTHTVQQASPVALWVTYAGGQFESSPALGEDGAVYLGNDDGYLYSFHPDGEVRWRYQTQGAVKSTPAIGEDGTIYFGSNDSYFYALNPDGTLKWRHRTNLRITASPAIGHDGTVYIGSWDGRLFAFNPDGSVRWTWDHGSRFYSSVAVAPTGVLYVGSADGNLYALNPDGTIRWIFETEGSIESSPAIDSEGNIYVGSNDGGVYAVRPDGTQKWKHQTEGSVVASPIVDSRDYVYVGSSDGTFFAFHGQTGFTTIYHWLVDLGAPIIDSAAIDENGWIYQPSTEGFLRIFAYDYEENELVDGAGPLIRATSSPVIGPDEILYFGALDRTAGIPAMAGPQLDSWSLFRADAQRTGRSPIDPADFQVDPPEIILEPTTEWSPSGGHATFEVEVESDAPVTYQWKRNGVSLAEGPNTVGVNTPVLRLRNVSAAMAGLYTVEVSNTGGTVESEPVELVVDGVTDYDFEFEVDNLLWDLTGNYEYDVEVLSGVATVNYTLTHDARGALSGAGTLSYTDSAGSFELPIDVRGRLRGARHVTRGTLDIRTQRNGGVEYQGEVRRASIRILHRFEIEPWFNQLRGRTITRSSLQGHRSQSLTYPSFVIPLPPEMDGSWRLEIDNVKREGRRLTAQGRAILSNGREIPFDGRGSYARGFLRLTLVGRNGEVDNRRNRITLSIEDGEPVAFRGRILGQTP